jgi:hypothetical protein
MQLHLPLRIVEEFRSWRAMNETTSPNIEKIDDNTQCSTPDAKAGDENGPLQDCEILSYDEAKDYVLKHRSIALPKRFLRGRTYRCQRIESLAARFIYRPSLLWRRPLDDWRRELLTKCFGLEIIEVSNMGQYYAKERRQPIPDRMLSYVEILEELWQFEHETATQLIKATKLYRQSRTLSLPEPFDFVVEELKRKKESLTQRLCAIVAHEWLLIDCIVWAEEWPTVDTELVGERYRRFDEAWWVGFMKKLCKRYKVPRWILKERIAGAFVGFTDGNHWTFPDAVLNEFSVEDGAET